MIGLQTTLKKIVSFIITAIAACFLMQCAKPLDPATVAAPPADFAKTVTGLSVTFNRLTDNATLRWNNHDTAGVSFFRIFRTTILDKDSNPDPTTVVSTENRRYIAKSESTFTDVLELVNTVYWYGIKPVRVVGNDTTEGLLSSPLVDCRVGVEISFNINKAALFTVTDKCSLYVNDPADTLASIRFTNNVNHYLLNMRTNGFGQTINIDLSNPLTFSSNAQLQALMDSSATQKRWIRAKQSGTLPPGTLSDSVAAFAVPNFDSLDLSNPNPKMTAVPQVDVFPWTLAQGNGVKTVYAELTYKPDPTGKVKIDTLKSVINIRPYRIVVKLKNSTDPGTRTMRVYANTINSATVENYTVYTGNIDFGVSIFADTSINQEFDYWLITPDSASPLIAQPGDQTIFLHAGSQYAWLQAPSIHSHLTGSGPAHDDNFVYHYSIDTTNPNTIWKPGNSNTLTRTIKTQDPSVKTYAFRIVGSNYYNELATPGSYWGANPGYFDENHSMLVFAGQTPVGGQQACQVTLSGLSPSQAYHEMVKMNPSALYNAGVKEFAVALRFTGRFFNDVRTVLSFKEVDGATYVGQTYFGLYPPKAVFFLNQSGVNPDWIGNDCTITGPFNYSLKTLASVQSSSHASIEQVLLVIAQFPDTMQWNPFVTPAQMTIDQLYSYRHLVIPYNVQVPNYILDNVRWANVDPSSWPSGRYLMAVITQDEYGNRGIAPTIPSSTLDQLQCNPWRVTVASGK
ncbi:MAG: hypothetical protein PHC61_05795 [Chitinivibrionales bacterium]|nr:hypothetical protein [Chitinivibrionales bacterium]